EQLGFEPVPIRQVIGAAVALCAPKAEAKGVAIAIDCGEGLESSLNAPLFEQAVSNLVDNAVKYSEANQEVRVTAAQDEDAIVIRVIDHGAGIPAEHIPRLFERFYRVDKARSRNLGGTGLGLSIVRHIVLVHGGRVDVASRPGKGSTFSIYLPREQAEEGE
ncbi:MAG: ATP-binding protein, partial [Candidatus Hydrogenedentes bacterium]|nr:ATP-binding protein [Candidatus Hydrogenedentota bacterium]